jgi:hypothetical protein
VSDIDIILKDNTNVTYHPVGWDDWLFMSMASKRFTSKDGHALGAGVDVALKYDDAAQSQH